MDLDVRGDRNRLQIPRFRKERECRKFRKVVCRRQLSPELLRREPVERSKGFRQTSFDVAQDITAKLERSLSRYSTTFMMCLDIFAHIPYCQRGNTMGTQLAPREDTPVELVEVPLLSALGVLWMGNYTYALETVVAAMREAHIECAPLRGWQPFGGIGTGISLRVTVRILDNIAGSLDIMRNSSGLHIAVNGPGHEMPLVPREIIECQVILNLASLEDDELRQLGLTRAAR